MASLIQKITAQTLPVLSVRTIEDDANSIRTFERNNKNSVRASLISSNTASNNQFNGCEILTLNGIDDPGHIFSMLDKDNTHHFELSKSINPSQDDVDFVNNLNAVAKGVHDVLTDRYVVCINPRGNESMVVSSLNFPVIFKIDSDYNFPELLNENTPSGICNKY